MLTAKEILERDELGIGCGNVTCSAPTYLTKAWYTFEAAIRLQVVQAYALFRPYREILPAAATVDSETQVWMAVFEPLIRSPGGWWLQGFEDLDPNLITLTRKPGKKVFPEGHLMVSLEGEKLTIEEAAWALNIPEQELFSLKLRVWDHQLIDEVMKRQQNV
jgi:hypothetical protein